jgi:pimeloyl-ACP methyl ester carboxylesterase
VAEPVRYEEFHVFVPAVRERLSAVLCAPRGPIREPGVVLLSGGNYTRTHRNRMWVRAARALAARGHPSIRLDYRGVGDSTGEITAFRLDTPLQDDALAAADFMRRGVGIRAILPVATCFGGRTALAAAAGDPGALGAVIFPVPVGGTSGVGLPRRTRFKLRIRRMRAGQALLDHRAVQRARGLVASRRRAPEGATGQFAADLRAAAASGAVWFIYGERSPGLEALRRVLRRLPPMVQGSIHLEVVPGIELAGFRSLREQEIAIDRVVRLVGEAADSIRPAAGLAAEVGSRWRRGS